MPHNIRSIQDHKITIKNSNIPNRRAHVEFERNRYGTLGLETKTLPKKSMFTGKPLLRTQVSQVINRKTCMLKLTY